MFQLESLIGETKHTVTCKTFVAWVDFAVACFLRQLALGRLDRVPPSFRIGLMNDVCHMYEASKSLIQHFLGTLVLYFLVV